MPSIKIREIDATSGGAAIVPSDVVFVPGFVNPITITTSTTVADPYVPILCQSIAEFESYFGKTPASFTSNQYYFTNTAGAISVLEYGSFSENAVNGTLSDTNGNVMISAGYMDPGYVYAKELLTKGLPVYFVRCNENCVFDNDTQKYYLTTDTAHNTPFNTAIDALQSNINIAQMYKVLSERSSYAIWTELQDTNEYIEIKYLTTGGYPTFEFFSNVISYEADLVTLTQPINSRVFNQQMRNYNITSDVMVEFTFAVNTITVETMDELTELLPTADVDKFYYVTATNAFFKVQVTEEEEEEQRSWIPASPD